jgi:hypothetical protein
MMGTDAAAAARFAEPDWKCRSTMQSAYPSTVRMVSARQEHANDGVFLRAIIRRKVTLTGY